MIQTTSITVKGTHHTARNNKTGGHTSETGSSKNTHTVMPHARSSVAAHFLTRKITCFSTLSKSVHTCVIKIKKLKIKITCDVYKRVSISFVTPPGITWLLQAAKAATKLILTSVYWLFHSNPNRGGGGKSKRETREREETRRKGGGGRGVCVPS